MSKKTYLELKRRYDRLSHENTMRLRNSKKPDRFEFAEKRESRIWNALLSDCKRYLTENDMF